MGEALKESYNWVTDDSTELQNEGLKLRQKVLETERAFNDAMMILSDLDQYNNRKLLCRSLNQVKREKRLRIDPQDVEGCRLITVDREELKKEFGVLFFPITLVVPIDKWEQIFFVNIETGEKFDRIPPDAIYDKESEYYPPLLSPPYESGYGANLRMKLFGFTGWTEPTPGGFFIPGQNTLPSGGFLRRFLQKSKFDPYFVQYPFILTGIAFYSEKLLEQRGAQKHEDLHRVYRLYSPFNLLAESIIKGGKTDLTIPSELIRKAHENILLNEINAYRESVKVGEMKWYDMENKENPDTVYGTLLSDLYSEISQKVEENKLLQACQTMEYIRNYLSEPVITHILLHCENFDDLIAWSKIKPEELNELSIKD